MTKKSDKAIIDTTDPFKRRIVLHESTWKGHILTRQDKKVDMITKLSFIKQTIEEPLYIGESWKIGGREIYYKYYENLGKYAAVVVDHSETPAFVVTAFKTFRMNTKPFKYVDDTTISVILKSKIEQR